MEMFRSIWLFIQNQILGMKWLNEVIGKTLSAFGIDSLRRTATGHPGRQKNRPVHHHVRYGRYL